MICVNSQEHLRKLEEWYQQCYEQACPSHRDSDYGQQQLLLFPKARQMLQRYIQALNCLDKSFIADFSQNCPAPIESAQFYWEIALIYFNITLELAWTVLEIFAHIIVPEIHCKNELEISIIEKAKEYLDYIESNVKAPNNDGTKRAWEYYGQLSGNDVFRDTIAIWEAYSNGEHLLRYRYNYIKHRGTYGFYEKTKPTPQFYMQKGDEHFLMDNNDTIEWLKLSTVQEQLQNFEIDELYPYIKNIMQTILHGFYSSYE